MHIHLNLICHTSVFLDIFIRWNDLKGLLYEEFVCIYGGWSAFEVSILSDQSFFQLNCKFRHISLLLHSGKYSAILQKHFFH